MSAPTISQPQHDQRQSTCDGSAIIYCEGAFRSSNGKTAHGLVRRTSRYHVLAVIDSQCAGEDAGELLDGKRSGIPIVSSLEAALERQPTRPSSPSMYFVIGLAPDGGRLPPTARRDVLRAMQAGLHVDSGLHDFLSEDAEIAAAASDCGIRIRDVRKPPRRKDLHFFTGKIEAVTARKVAVLGTDSAIGKRTTAWLLVDACRHAGHRAELIGTGQTAWMQGARYGVILDSLVNDFVAGEIEHAVWKAWQEQRPDVLVMEGQGSLMNPAYPGGYELLAAARPDVVVLQHAPSRKEYDGFPGYPLHTLERQIQAIEMVSEKPVVAVTINHEGLADDQVSAICEDLERAIGVPVRDVLRDGADDLIQSILPQ